MLLGKDESAEYNQFMAESAERFELLVRSMNVGHCISCANKVQLTHSHVVLCITTSAV